MTSRQSVIDTAQRLLAAGLVEERPATCRPA
jgi:hypothetical protein